ncbi:F0F1 ATP synthase subunit epsilon [Shewanella sp. SG41-4]|uniref:F0F1 ATP synthase subunit epsilon n=1 Tax=Shewanella sp. SG41-4 TaxID=2760976 RepID=UPI001600CCEE|nr:F0F1 ATP synthase subunit epsilon [Shewanella sp. SG41-4]MBB1437167.1 F0F1 ATP synthase subunit epsilon [Shewanella sp. SG41-4]
MLSAHMNLKILLPYKVFAQLQHVVRIVAVTPQGSFGILPHRLDCVASLTAGLLVYECEGADEVYVAIDEGVLVKTGFDVVISVRNAIGGLVLSDLHQAVKQEFMHLDEQEQQLRSVLVKMESNFMRRLTDFHHDRP